MPVPRPSYPMIAGRQLDMLARESGIPDELVPSVSKLLRKILDKQAIDERLNYQWIVDNMGGGGGSRSSTVVVAAADSYDASKEGADYVCDGTDDQEEIQAALDQGAGWPGGRVLLTEGNFSITAPLEIYQSTLLDGYGMNTTNLIAGFGFTASSPMITSSSGGADRPFDIYIKHMTISGDIWAQDIMEFIQGSRILLEELEIIQASRYGVSLLRTSFDHSDHTIRNCHIGSCGTAAIYAEHLNRGHITSNQFASPLSFKNGGYTLVADNHVWTSAAFGMKLDLCAGMAFRGNSIHKQGGNDGFLLVASDENSFVGNVVSNSADGFDIDANSDDNFLTVNDLFGCTTAINDAGTGTVKINNRGDDI